MVGISPAIRATTHDSAMGVPPPSRIWVHPYGRWRCRGRRGCRMPLVQRLRMGGLLSGSWGAESSGWLLVLHYRSLRVCLNLSLVRRPAGDGDAVLADLPVGRSRETCWALGRFRQVPVLAGKASSDGHALWNGRTASCTHLRSHCDAGSLSRRRCQRSSTSKTGRSKGTSWSLRGTPRSAMMRGRRQITLPRGP